jgi:hypothetical protein
MIEYPSILPSSKAPRERCYAFEKLDGSNVRFKYTQKRGFCLFGSRTQLIDETNPCLGLAITIFKKQHESTLVNLIKKEWPNEREVIVFGEFFGDNSFAGLHKNDDCTRRIVFFDIMVGHKNRKFLLPQEFVHLCYPRIPTPKVVMVGNLTDAFIQGVRNNDYAVDEGVVCKGTQRTGSARGGVWMAKIKTQEYLDKLFKRYGEEGIRLYGEELDNSPKRSIV